MTQAEANEVQTEEKNLEVVRLFEIKRIDDLNWSFPKHSVRALDADHVYRLSLVDPSRFDPIIVGSIIGDPDISDRELIIVDGCHRTEAAKQYLHNYIKNGMEELKSKDKQEASNIIDRKVEQLSLKTIVAEHRVYENRALLFQDALTANLQHTALNIEGKSRTAMALEWYNLGVSLGQKITQTAAAEKFGIRKATLNGEIKKQEAKASENTQTATSLPEDKINAAVDRFSRVIEKSEPAVAAEGLAQLLWPTVQNMTADKKEEEVQILIEQNMPDELTPEEYNNMIRFIKCMNNVSKKMKELVKK